MIELESELAYMAERPELFTKEEMAGKLGEASKAISKARNGGSPPALDFARPAGAAQPLGRAGEITPQWLVMSGERRENERW